ncbi:hypothetical protein O3G_MSEX014352 [Manduca sexta]|uniref:E3 ubiquitin-protein ligase E3D n=1 Tax=Manduca sexta TaxID=7130 RepID=A0A921ZUX0_MANSE|nr:hypothetical protein O3G_MSEX014352 [Manduca sexta]
MLIKSVLMELRSRLRSCNVYITTGVDFTKECNLKISIKSNRIILNYYNDYKSSRRDSLSSIESLSDCYSEDEFEATTIIPIVEFCQIIPNSMSCLKIDKNTISFRILTEPTNGGNFYKEFISENLEDSVKSSDVKVNVRVGDAVKIICSNCSNLISDGCVKFERILELPSNNMDMSEWFCHGHSHGSQTEVVLKSNKLDFLHRLTYFAINPSVLSEKTNKFNSKRAVYHCNRCLAWLGLKNKDNIKLFNSEVKIQQNDTEQLALTFKNQLASVHVSDFVHTIECMMKEFNLGLQFTIMCKIVLECTISVIKKQYLLIWVMDKELQVLRNKDQIVTDKIELQSNIATKILFKIELELNDEVESWLSDPSVVSTDISKNMFHQGVEHLQQMSLKVPETFRNTNGYSVSYLKI